MLHRPVARSAAAVQPPTFRTAVGEPPASGRRRYGRLIEIPPISSERLHLVSLAPETIAALLERRSDADALVGATIPDAWPDENDERFLRLRLEDLRRDPEVQPWLVRALVLPREGGAVMGGHAGFHGPPGVNGPGYGDALELGYTVFPDFRGRGYATEAAAALLGWARGRGVERFVASVAPENEPSLAVVRKLGFVRTGEQWDDEDGLELVFELGPG